MGTKSRILKNITMKSFKSLFVFLIVLSYLGCTTEDRDTNFVDQILAPANVSAVFSITQDNTGLVTIAPNGEGAVSFEVYYGDEPNHFDVVSVGQTLSNIYPEGVYTVTIVAIGINGLKTTVTRELTVSFLAPENLVVTIEPVQGDVFSINVSATADLEAYFEVYFGDVIDETPVMFMEGETITHTYSDVGDYVVRVIAYSGGSETTEYTETITIVNPIVLPITFEDATVNYAFTDFGNVASSVVTNPDISGGNTSAMVGRSNKPVGAEVWGGTFLQLDDPIDFSTLNNLKVNVWSPVSGITVKLKLENATNGSISAEVDVTNTVANAWETLTFDFSSSDLSQEYHKIVLFFDFGNPGNGNMYYFDDINLSTPVASTSNIVGTWKMASEPGSLKVGPSPGSGEWWSIDAAGVTARACYFNDTFIFTADGAFNNNLGAQTWIEGWQGGGDNCGTPVGPYNGSIPATYTYNTSTNSVTVNGTGAYIGIPKANNAGELPNVAVPNSITYDVTFLDVNTMVVGIEAGSGVFWTYKLVRDTTPTTPIHGIWKMASEPGSLKVGPSPGSGDWWSIDAAGVTARACYFNDTYIFGTDGSFKNVLGTQSWIEGWQGGGDACGTPVAPHNGLSAYTFNYNQAAGTITVNGTGSYIGLPKANNAGELPNVAVPSSITYNVTFIDSNTISVGIESGSGVFWTYKLIRI